MTMNFNPGRYAANDRFYCDFCEVWHIDSDDDPVAHCQRCGRQLCSMYDYACISCGHFVCDNELQTCQEDDCDIIICADCVGRHLTDVHSPEVVAL